MTTIEDLKERFEEIKDRYQNIKETTPPSGVPIDVWYTMKSSQMVGLTHKINTDILFKIYEIEDPDFGKINQLVTEIEVFVNGIRKDLATLEFRTALELIKQGNLDSAERFTVSENLSDEQKKLISKKIEEKQEEIRKKLKN